MQTDGHRSPKFTVAICGGGIAGLTTAIALQRISHGDIHIDIYEAASHFSEIGAGVMVYKRPWKVLKRLGLTEKLREIATVPADEDEPKLAFEMRKSDQREGVHFHDFVLPLGNITFHRADFLQVLVSELDPSVTTSHFSKKLASYDQTPLEDTTASRKHGVFLQFSDGTSSQCDVLIGADGIHSITRKLLLEEAADKIAHTNSDTTKFLQDMKDPVWSGSVAYRALLSGEKLRSLNPTHRALTTPQNYMGKHKHLIVFPLMRNDRKLVNIVAFHSYPDKEGQPYIRDAVHACSPDEIIPHYEGWEEEVQQLLECIEAPTKWSINALRELPMSVIGRVALIGDAAHAMTPHIGSGAGQAIEDAYILAHLLSHPRTTPESIEHALKVYESVRLSFAIMVHRMSRANGRLYEFTDQTWTLEHEERVEGGIIKCKGEDAVDMMRRLREVGQAIVENRKWSWMTDVDDDLQRALDIYMEMLNGIIES